MKHAHDHIFTLAIHAILSNIFLFCYNYNTIYNKKILISWIERFIKNNHVGSGFCTGIFSESISEFRELWIYRGYKCLKVYFSFMICCCSFHAPALH